ncbi:MAG: hypothetical protein U0V70_09140 [Terriglobia bacterium]
MATGTLTPKSRTLTNLFPTPTTVHPILISYSSSKNVFEVGPPQNVSNGDVLTWNCPDSEVTITFPRIAGAKIVDPESISFGPSHNGSMRVVIVDFEAINNSPTVASKKDATGRIIVTVPYSVYCTANNAYAVGTSDPKIIVKGP